MNRYKNKLKLFVLCFILMIEVIKLKERRDVTRTKNAIERAYLELLFKKGYKKITVNEVINLADVSRGTFYAHYKDIPDLEEKVEERAIQDLRKACEGNDGDRRDMSFRERLERVFDRFYSFKEDFSNLLLAENNSKMMDKVRGYLISALDRVSTKDKLVERIGEAKTEMVFNIMAGGFVSGFEYLIRHEDEISRDDAIDLMCDIVSGGLQQVLDDIAG